MIKCAVGLTLTLLAGVAVAAERPPSVVFVLADDLGWGDPGCYNAESKAPTPHIDRLAREGMRFTDAHSPSAVCTPTRYGVLTGRYSWRSRLKRGVLWNGFARALVEDGRPTVASFLAQRGYRTGVAGKWHLGWDWQAVADAPVREDGGPLVTANRGHDLVDYAKPVLHGPQDLGFHEAFLLPASLDMAPYLYLRNDRALRGATEHTAASKRRTAGGGGFWRAGPIAPGFEFEDVLPATVEEGVAFVSRVPDDQPFFLYLPVAAPHTPWVPTPEFEGSSEAGWYGDFVTQTDWAVGRILQALDREGRAEDTLVIVTSDNGSHWWPALVEEFDHRANGPWRGQKADIHEGGHRVPFVARWPGVVPAGTTCDATICHVDLFATVADMLGTTLPDEGAEDSFSWLPLLRDPKATPPRQSVVHHSLDGTFAIRRGPWKLVAGNLGSGGFTQPKKVKPEGKLPGGQLYDLAADPGETKNVYSEHPKVVEELEAELSTLRERGRSR